MNQENARDIPINMKKKFIANLFLFFLFFSIVSVCVAPSLVRAEETASPKADLKSAVEDFSKLSDDNKNMLLSAAGIPSASDLDPIKLAAYFIFGAVGFVAFTYGKKNTYWRPMAIGIALMVYPYFISGTVAIYLIGIVLTAALYFWRE